MKATIFMFVTVFVAATAVCAKEKRESFLKTYVYKTVDKIEIKADVHAFADDNAEKRRPVVAWYHGGALINGSRVGIPKDVLAHCQSKGYVVVSLDYRLAPEVKLPAIIEDLRDGLKWIREEGPKAFHADPQKLIVAGGSAGGYLTMMSGIAVKPPPLALVAFWGYGDVDGDWYTKPDKYFLEHEKIQIKEKVLRGVGKKVHTSVTWKTGGKARSAYYIYLRQTGLWTKEVTGFDPATEKEKLDPYCPVRNISPTYPSICMIHGEVDEDVPYEKSVEMARELKKHGVTHTLLSVPKGMHGLRGGDKAVIAKVRKEALAFIDQEFGKVVGK